MRRSTFTILIVIFIMLAGMNTSAAPIYGPRAEEGRATLMVEKWLSSDELFIGDIVIVHVNITNNGRGYANNLTITEPLFGSFIGDIAKDYEKYTYVRLGYGANVYYEYNITVKNEGQYFLEPTLINFVSDDGFEMSAQSAVIPFDVLKEVPIEDAEEVWQNMLYFSLTFIAVPVFFYYLNRFLNR